LVRVPARPALDHRQDAAALLDFIQRLRARTRRLSANVEKVGAVLDHPQRGIDRTLRIQQQTTVGE
jgi:hypothetical protein